MLPQPCTTQVPISSLLSSIQISGDWEGPKVPTPSLRKGLDLKITDISHKTLGGLWERKECFGVKLHLNSVFVVFMSGMSSPIWALDLNWFYYEMETVNIKIVHNLPMSYNSMACSLSGKCNFSLSGCLCWHSGSLAPLGMILQLDHCFTELAGCLMKLTELASCFAIV